MISTPAGVMHTRFSAVLISLRIPMFIVLFLALDDWGWVICRQVVGRGSRSLWR
jgi:hypothetical protein